MKIKFFFALLLFVVIINNSFATNLKISNIEFQLSEDTTVTPRVKMNIEWETAWNNEKNRDAVWIFVKFNQKSGWYRHAKIEQTGHRVIHNPMNIKAQFETAENQAGVFIALDQKHRGKINWTIEILLDRKSIEKVNFWESQIQVYGIEMVYIPEGSFTLGDPGEEAMTYNVFYKSKGEGKRGGLYEINSEKGVIEIGPDANQLYYQVNNPEYQGDQKGTVPADFPKGYSAFYCMKYELTQGQYADFLNSISDGQTHHRANFNGRDYYKNRGSIYFDRQKEIYLAESPNRPCNYITWDDAMAFADWAGIRPMTELEYTKAARGPEQPITKQYPWGTNSKTQLQRGISLEDELVMFNGMNESELTDENRAVFGASYFWVMDLAGSLWEKVVTIGNEKGRAFVGNHGDGRINSLGFANEEGWPKGFDEGGYGYRGGGYYYHGRNYHGFNPHSPIGWRRFGAWSGGNRSIAYSTRFVRTAKK